MAIVCNHLTGASMSGFSINHYLPGSPWTSLDLTWFLLLQSDKTKLDVFQTCRGDTERVGWKSHIKILLMPYVMESNQ